MDVVAIITQLAIAETPDLVRLGQAIFGELGSRQKALAAANVAVNALDAAVDEVEKEKLGAK